MLALSIKTIQKLERDKQIVAYRIGGRYLIKESDLIDIEKTFEQTIEYDLLKLMQKLENEKKDQQGRQQLINDEDEHIKEIIRKVFKEENNSLFAVLNYFKNKFIKLIQFIKNKLFNRKDRDKYRDL